MQSEILKKIHKNIIRDFLDTIILAKLRNSTPLSGYDLIEFTHKKFGILIGPGTIYAVLYSMERKGLIKGESTQGKRIYTLTSQGRDTIGVILKLKEEIQGFMRTILDV